MVMRSANFANTARSFMGSGIADDFGRFYWKIFRRRVSIGPILTSLLHCSLAEIIPDPKPLMIRPFVSMLATIACAPLVLRYHWEHQYSMKSPSYRRQRT